MIIVIKQSFDIVAVNIDRANVHRNKVFLSKRSVDQQCEFFIPLKRYHNVFNIKDMRVTNSLQSG